MDLKTLEAAARYKVNHAGDGIGAVQRGSAVFQHLDALKGNHGNQGGDIDKGFAIVVGDSGLGLATAVEQHQVGANAQSPEIDIRCAEGAAAGKVIRAVLGARIDG